MDCIGEKHRTSEEWAVIVKDKRRALSTLVRRSFYQGNHVARRSFSAAIGDRDLGNPAAAVALIRNWGRMPFFQHLPEDPLMPYDRDHFYNYVFEDDYQVCEEQEVMLVKWASLATVIEIEWTADLAIIQWNTTVSIDEVRRCSRVMQYNSMLLVEHCGESNYMLKCLSRKLQFMLVTGAGRSGQFLKMHPLILDNIGSFLLGVKQDWIPYPIFDSNEECPLLPTDRDHFWYDELSLIWVNELHEEFWRLRVALLGFAKQQDFLRSEVDKMEEKQVRLLKISCGLAWNF
jgi:hypothetical protein